MSDEVGAVEPFLGDPFGGNNSDQGSYGPIGPVPSGPTPQPNPNQGPPGPPGPNIDRYAATRIVSSDPTQGTDLTIQGAINNLPAGGGTIFVKDSQSVSATVVLADKSITFVFAAGATVTAPAALVTLFEIPDGLTEERRYTWDNLEAIGASVVGQTFLKLSDSNSFGEAFFYQPDISGFQIIFYYANGDVNFTRPTRVFAEYGCIMPTALAGNEIGKTDSPAGTELFGASLFGFNCIWLDPDHLDRGWTLDFDGDLLLKGVRSQWAGDSHIDGIDVVNSYFEGTNRLVVPSSITNHDNSFDSTRFLEGSYWNGVSLKTVTGFLKIVNSVWAFCGVVFGGQRCQLIGFDATFAGQFGLIPIVVDIQAGADDCAVENGVFGASTTASIQSAAARARVSTCKFAQGGAAKTITDAGAGDFTLGVGNIGVSSGGGTSLAANSRVTVGTGINLA